jgi:predicted dehydrogenase
VIRIGILGAARIAPTALVRPARQVDGVQVVAVAARDPERARKFAARHGVDRACQTYEELLASEDIDAVYNPLPNGLHAEWTTRALGEGKHVLCEKPFTANADEARAVSEVAEGSGLTVMEAFHYRYHPLAERMRAIVRGESELGDFGAVRHVETALCIPLPFPKDIRYQWRLGGGATMDTGCYAIHCLRLLGPGLPEVTSARATLRGEQIDRVMEADFRFPEGATGRITASLWSHRLLAIRARVVSDRGELRVFNYVAPQAYHRLKVRLDGRTHRERVRGDASYTHQLRAFRDAVRGDAGANLTPPADAIVTMGLIDDVYRAAGLAPRGGV